MKEGLGLKKLLFKLYNLCDHGVCENNINLEDYNILLDAIHNTCYDILNNPLYFIDKKVRNKLALLLKDFNFHNPNENNIKLVANLILKLNLENQKLS